MLLQNKTHIKYQDTEIQRSKMNSKKIPCKPNQRNQIHFGVKSISRGKENIS